MAVTQAAIPDEEFACFLDWTRSRPEVDDPELLESRYARLGYEVAADPWAPVVGERIRSALVEGAPLSVVRIGDGEASLMGYLRYPDTPVLDEFAARRSLAAFRGLRGFASAWLHIIRDSMLRSVEDADIVGVLGLWRRPAPMGFPSLEERLRKDPRGISGHVRGKALMLDLAAEGRLRASLVCSAHLYLGVVRDIWSLLEGTRRIVMITSRPEVVKHVVARVPEASVQWIDARPDPGASEGTILRSPDFLDRIEAELPRELSGTLCLIGAGPWAEIYCMMVRQRGGVGVDIGSGFDLLDGQSTRPVHRSLGFDQDNPFSVHAGDPVE